MTLEPREELLSAYLDNETSAAQRAQVEGWLAESAELRQLRDELLAVREAMQSLPRRKLAEDLGPAVVRRAEQAVLRGTDAHPPATTTPELPPLWLRGAGWRRLAWPALALAAALAILIFDHREQNAPRPAERQVASAPAGETSVQAVPADSPAAAEPLATSRYASGGKPTDQSAAPSAAPAGGGDAPGYRQVDNQYGAANPLMRQKTAQNAPANSDVVCEVSPEYLRDGSFEKLLVRLNIPVVRQEASPQVEKPAEPDAALRDQALVTSQLVYSVQANDAQVDEVLTELRKETPAVRSVSRNTLPFGQSQKKSLGLARRVVFTLRAAAETATDRPADAPQK